MATVTRKLVVDVFRQTTFSTLYAKQGDVNGRLLNVELQNNGTKITISQNAIVVLDFRRPDGEAKGFAGSVNNDGTVTVTLTSWCMEVFGKALASVSIIENSTKLTTLHWKMQIEPAEYGGDDITEDENYDILVTLIDRVQEEVPEAVTAWLEEHIQQGYAVDDTLTVSGAAADAKVVGDTFAGELESELKRIALAAYATDNASGSIASFSDGAENIPVKSLSLDFEPVQNLNGYDNPWPAGGGKNKLDLEYMMPGGTTSSDGKTFTISMIAQRQMFVFSDTNIDVILSCKSMSFGGSKFRISFYDTSDTLINNIFFNTTEFSNTIRGVSKCRVDYGANGVLTLTECMLRLASVSDATFAPYSNICPISGHTEVNVYDDPKYGGTIAWNQLIENGNFADGSNWRVYNTNNGTISMANNTATIQYSVTSPGGYTVGLNYNKSVGFVTGHKYLVSAMVNTNFATAIDIEIGTGIGVNKPVTLNAWNSLAWVSPRPSGNSGQTFIIKPVNSSIVSGSTMQVRNVQLIDLTAMFGSTKADEIYAMERASAGSGAAYFKSLFPKDYYPYNAGEETCVSAVNGDPYTKQTISLGQTVYGGTLDVVSGVLTVDRAILTFEGDGSYYPGTTFPFLRKNLASGVKGDYSKRLEIISNQYSTITSTTTTDSAIRLTGDGNAIFVYDSRFTDADTANTLTTENPIQIVYPLATPTTVQLTPTQVSTLLGQNNIWSDAGDIEVTYRADTTLYIQQLTKPDDDFTADASIASGKFFMVGNRLFISTTAISAGESIVIGTNCTEVSLADALNQLNA